MSAVLEVELQAVKDVWDTLSARDDKPSPGEVFQAAWLAGREFERSLVREELRELRAGVELLEGQLSAAQTRLHYAQLRERQLQARKRDAPSGYDPGRTTAPEED